MEKDYIIRLETEADYRKVENLTREAFWNVYRPGCSEHYVLHCYRNRKEFVPELDFVMEKDNKIIGHVMYARSEINADNGRVIPIMTFGPISIEPHYQGKGYGSILLQYSMDKAKNMGTGALAITGNIGFYGKLGFVVASTMNIHYYAEPRTNEVPYFLVKELVDGFLSDVSGMYRDPKGYSVDEKETEYFDALFPVKKKLKLPGQIF